MKCKVYITDEGFGPLVRQSAIIDEVHAITKDIHFTIQTHQHFNAAKRIIKGVSYIDKYNNITWDKHIDGTPNITAIKTAYTDYLSRSDNYIRSELEYFAFDLVISDYVYEAFEVAHRKQIPSFGVAHFTWDWFFSKLYPPPLTPSVLDRFLDFANKADVIYFPPFTPREILNHFRNKAKVVPLIVRNNIQAKKIILKDKFKVLIMDSGSRVLKESIQKILNRINNVTDFHFFVSSAFQCEHDNVSFIDEDELFVDYINDMDLVIGRAGFNTISECIALRTPMLLLSEGLNPEMNENIINIKNTGFGSFISINQFTDELDKYLPRFICSEYRLIRENMKNHTIDTNGARVIAADILDRVLTNNTVSVVTSI